MLAARPAAQAVSLSRRVLQDGCSAADPSLACLRQQMVSKSHRKALPCTAGRAHCGAVPLCCFVLLHGCAWAGLMHAFVACQARVPACRYSAGQEAHILFSVSVRAEGEAEELMQRLKSSSMPTINLSNIEAAQVRSKGLHGAALAPSALINSLRSGRLHCCSLLQAAAASCCSVRSCQCCGSHMLEREDLSARMSVMLCLLQVTAVGQTTCRAVQNPPLPLLPMAPDHGLLAAGAPAPPGRGASPQLYRGASA